MTRSTRILAAAGLVLFGGWALLFAGGQVTTCLGPLGITPVECAQAVWSVSEVGIGRPILAATLAIATFLVWPVSPGRRARVAVGGILGATIGAVAYLVFRPVVEGLDSNFRWIAVRPLDPYVVATYVIVAALLGTILMRLGLRWAGSAGSWSGR